MKNQPKIILTNDDGIFSPGLRVLYEAVKDLGEIYIVAPSEPKSAVGLGITLHKPIRVHEVTLWGKARGFAINGTPSDSIHVAREVVVRDKIDLVLSGINIGDNTSMQTILSSGTLGAAAEASLMGIKSIAFSANVQSGEEFYNEKYSSIIKKVIRIMVSHILENGFPKGVDVISVNFPNEIKSGVYVVPAARLRWWEKLEERKDPRGAPYYWLYGEPTEPEPDTDVYVVHVLKGIALTPLVLDMSASSGKAYSQLNSIAKIIQMKLEEKTIE